MGIGDKTSDYRPVSRNASDIMGGAVRLPREGGPCRRRTFLIVYQVIDHNDKKCRKSVNEC